MKPVSYKQGQSLHLCQMLADVVISVVNSGSHTFICKNCQNPIQVNFDLSKNSTGDDYIESLSVEKVVDNSDNNTSFKFNYKPSLQLKISI